MKIRLGLTGRLILSFVALVLLSDWIDYRFGKGLHSTVVQQRELDKITAIARTIEPQLKRETEWISAQARLVQHELSRTLQVGGRERRGSILQTLDLYYRESLLDILEATDDKGMIIYRAHAPGLNGDMATGWGIEEALSGTGLLVSRRDHQGVYVQHIEPIRANHRIVGAVIAGMRIDGRFVDNLSKATGVEIVLIAHSGDVVASSKGGKAQPEPEAIAEAFQQKIPAYRTNQATHTTQVYLPLLIVDEAWVIMAELDSSSAYSLLHKIDADSLLLTILIIMGSLLVIPLVLRYSLKPLHELRLRAEKIVFESQGKTTEKPSYDDVASLAGTLNTLTDALMDRNRELTEQRADLRISAAAFESQEAMMITDADLVILRVNKAFTQITGYTGEELVGKKPRLSGFSGIETDFRHEAWEIIRRTGVWQGEVWDQRKNGEAYPKWLSISAVRNDEGIITHYIFTHVDITERKRSEEAIEKLAFFDPLTQLPNRKLLMDRLKQAITGSSRNGMFGAVLFIDLDYFKTLNDTMGHDTGDMLLQRVSERLTACVREDDTVARIGGDEFVVVLSNLSETAQDAANQTEIVGERILAALSDTYQFSGIAHRSSASIGVTLFRGHHASIGDLLKQADLAMYKAKESGRNTLRFFDPAMQTTVMTRIALEKDMREAIIAKQFFLHYQPQVDGNGHITGAEALLRWQHSEKGAVSPAVFIPLAEETGLILDLGREVIETACITLSEWESHPALADLTIAVNVSAHQIRQPDFVEQVWAAIEHSGANPQKLKLELTESVLVGNVEDIIEKMLALKARGIGFSLDDFGTGYSSLSYLKRLPLEQLKIDRSFVRDVLDDPNDASIARSIVGLAHSLGLEVIAEGVETEEQRNFLHASGCHAYQGYFFGRPLPIEQFQQLVSENLARQIRT